MIFFSRSVLLIAAAFLFALTLPTVAKAQEEPVVSEETGGAPAISGDVLPATMLMDILPGKTFWRAGSPFRLYFGEDKSFVHQTGEDYPLLGFGRHEGTWRINESGYICLQYKELVEENCFFVVRGPDTMRSWGMYDDPLFFFALPDTELPQMFTERWMNGRLILDDEMYRSFPDKLVEMLKLEQKADEYYANPPANEPADDLQEYVSGMIDHLMILPFGSIYHTASGKSMTLSQVETKEVIDNPALLAKKQPDSLWFVKDRHHCWITMGERHLMSCQLVYNGTSLDQPVEGYVTHTADGFTRILTKKFVSLNKAP